MLVLIMEQITIWMAALAKRAVLSVLPVEALKLTIALPAPQERNNF